MVLGSLFTSCVEHTCTRMSPPAFLSCCLRGSRLLPKIGLWLYHIQTPSSDWDTFFCMGAALVGGCGGGEPA